MLYCRPISEFSLFDEFKPGEFKIIDFMREHHHPNGKLNENILVDFRYFDAFSMEYDADGFCEGYNDYDDDELFNQFKRIVHENEKELDQIAKTLKDRGFIRTDNYKQSILISMIIDRDEECPKIFKGESWHETWSHIGLDYTVPFIDDAVDNFVEFGRYDHYMTLKPTTQEDLERIFDLLRDRLPPSQYEIMRFYILNAYEHDNDWYYTIAEVEALMAAFANIRNSQIASMINEIMDNTLF